MFVPVRYLAALALAVVFTPLRFTQPVFAQSIGAQASSTITLTGADRHRWDVSVHTGRQGVNRSETSDDWDHWYEAPHVTGSAGFYWTPTLKLEVDVARSGETTLYVPQFYPVPGQSWPYIRSRQHRQSTWATTAGVHYQFFDNRWFHPYVGAGIELVHERERADALPAMSENRSPSGQLLFPAVPALAALNKTTTAARPLVGGGFKVYLSQSVFARTDLRLSLSNRGAETMTWRVGAGVDF